jgi:hypothetical protein
MQADMIRATRGLNRARRLASAIRTAQFMARYDAEDSERRSGARLRSLQVRPRGSMGEPVSGAALYGFASQVNQLLH